METVSYSLWETSWETVRDTLSPLKGGVTSPLVCVPLSFISFFPQDESEDIEASDDNEEAEEEEGRSNGFHPSMRTPLAVISHVQGCVSVMLCPYDRYGRQSILWRRITYTPLPWSCSLQSVNT